MIISTCSSVKSAQMGCILFHINNKDIIRIEGKGNILILGEEICYDPILFAAMRDWYYSFGTEVLGRRYDLTIGDDKKITFCIEGETNDRLKIKDKNNILTILIKGEKIDKINNKLIYSTFIDWFKDACLMHYA